jgi:carbamoyltransferase
MKPTLAIYGIKDRNLYKYPGYTHDHNICLMEDGKILQYLQLERRTRKKYDNQLDYYIENILDEHFSSIKEFDLISVNSFVGNSFLSAKGRLRIEADFRMEFLQTPKKIYAYWEERPWEGKEVSAWKLSQEMAHIGTNIAFHGDFCENSLLVHFDGGASVSNFSAFLFKNERIKNIEAHWNLGYLSKFFNDNALAFRILGAHPGEHCSVPGKLMGFAGFGQYKPEIEDWLVKNDYFREYWKKEKEILYSIQENFKKEIDAFDTRDIFFQDIAATFQTIFERDLLIKFNILQEKYKTDYLYFSGGCALNIVTNTKILESKLFNDIFIPPCPGDSGLSIGAACILERKKGNIIKSHSPYLNNIGIEIKNNSFSNDTLLEIINLLYNGKIIGVCNGFGEAGPRALGNRSIIAIPNSKNIARKISEEMKGREWYRPIAPIMLKENAERVTGKKIHHLSKYMLLDWEILPEYRSQLEGVIHSNHTSRIQYIEENENPFIYNLLFKISKKGILGLINTSFNGKGEPIVHTPDDARRTALKIGLDAIIINYNLEVLSK